MMQSASSGIVTRVPYWYGVASSTPAHITVLYAPVTAQTTANVLFRLTDASGIIIPNITPTVTVSSGGGSVLSLDFEDASWPGVWSVNVRLGSASGDNNVFQIAAGGITQTFAIVSQ